MPTRHRSNANGRPGPPARGPFAEVEKALDECERAMLDPFNTGAVLAAMKKVCTVMEASVRSGWPGFTISAYRHYRRRQRELDRKLDELVALWQAHVEPPD